MALCFVDDSGSPGDSRYFVLAGYIAPESVWRAFIPEWQEVLEQSPKLLYVKMNEAARLEGQFAAFSRQQRDERVARFIDVILSHKLWEASVVLPAAGFSEILQPVLPDSYCSPYYFAFVGMTVALSAYYRHAGIDETVHFIFDKQQGKQHRAVRLYEHFKTYFPAKQLGRIWFADDKEAVPLQAADLIAWQTPRWLCSVVDQARPELQMLHVRRQWWYRYIVKDRGLREMREAIVANIDLLRKEVGAETVNELLTQIKLQNQRRGITTTRSTPVRKSSVRSGRDSG